MKQLQQPKKTLNVLLWTAQFLLAGSFLWAAAMKLFQPADLLAGLWPWAAEHRGLTTLTGIADLLAAIGLLAPALLRIQLGLTVYAAYGVIALMIAAIIFHVTRGEAGQIGVNIFFAALAGFIAWGRR